MTFSQITFIPTIPLKLIFTYWKIFSKITYWKQMIWQEKCQVTFFYVSWQIILKQEAKGSIKLGDKFYRAFLPSSSSLAWWIIKKCISWPCWRPGRFEQSVSQIDFTLNINVNINFYGLIWYHSFWKHRDIDK
jgi:hypothetical protein